jgi:hypothetical protein
MTNATVRANARTLPGGSQTNYQLLKEDFAEFELPIWNLMRMLRAAAHLQEEGDEDLRSSAKLIVDLALEKADELNEQYQRSWPGEGIDSRVKEDNLTAKAFIMRELDACERRLRETRTQAETIREGDAR